jgi:hypothetical protein
MQVNRPLLICKILILLSIFLLSCRNGEKVILRLALPSAHEWNYLFSVDIKSSIGKDSSISCFNSSLRTYLRSNSLERNGIVNFRLYAPRITSNFLSEQEKYNLERQFEKLVLTLRTKEGAVDTRDTVDLPVIMVGEWDLFRSFLKVLPALPERPVRAGERWERERQFPLETNHGKAIGHLYQLFTLDSISSDNMVKKAYLSWRFKYQIEPLSTDSIFLEKLPLNGNGKGRAVFDLNNKTIEIAHAFFSTQSESFSDITWMETVHLEMIK